jgi:hypothetical protein
MTPLKNREGAVEERPGRAAETHPTSDRAPEARLQSAGTRAQLYGIARTEVVGTV